MLKELQNIIYLGVLWMDFLKTRLFKYNRNLTMFEKLCFFSVVAKNAKIITGLLVDCPGYMFESIFVRNRKLAIG